MGMKTYRAHQLDTILPMKTIDDSSANITPGPFALKGVC